MNRRQKDNLTDAVEGFQRNDGKKPESQQSQEKPKKPEYQVVDHEGDVITLGQNGRDRNAASNSKEVIELSDLTEVIRKAVRAGIEEGLNEFLKKQKRKK